MRGNLALEIVSRFKVPLGILAAALVYGTVGYVAIFGWSGLDALYMTVMTLSTVGYREVRPLHEGGQVFTISLILLGVTALFTGLGILANSAASGELGEIIRRSRVGRRIDQLRGHHIVCAYGRVGRAAVEELRAHGVEVVVVEADPALEPLMRRAGVPYLIEDPTDEDVLEAAGVLRAEALVCAVDDDAVNVYITLTARSLNPGLTIVARAARASTAVKLRQAGADHVISPYVVSGSRMASLALRPALVDFIDMVTVGPNLRLDEIMVREGSSLIGRTVEAASEEYAGVTVLALKQASEDAMSAPPSGDTVLSPGDLLVAFGPRDALDAMES